MTILINLKYINDLHSEQDILLKVNYVIIDVSGWN